MWLIEKTSFIRFSENELIFELAKFKFWNFQIPASSCVTKCNKKKSNFKTIRTPNFEVLFSKQPYQIIRSVD